MTPTALIQLEDVSRVYPIGESEVRALDHVSLKIETGEFVAIMGASGLPTISSPAFGNTRSASSSSSFI